MDTRCFLQTVIVFFFLRIAVINHGIINLRIETSNPYFADVISFDKSVVCSDFCPRISTINTLVNSAIAAIREVVPLTAVHIPSNG